MRSPDTEGRYWWDESGNLLLWGAERIALEQQKVEQERQRASEAEQEIALHYTRLIWKIRDFTA